MEFQDEDMRELVRHSRKLRELDMKLTLLSMAFTLYVGIDVAILLFQYISK